MISRRTIFSLLLMLLLVLSLRVWAMGQRDPCDGLMPGGAHPASVYVDEGTRTVEMPCTSWLPRQPMWFLGMCLAVMMLAAVFLVNACGDLVRWLDKRRLAVEATKRW